MRVVCAGVRRSVLHLLLAMGLGVAVAFAQARQTGEPQFEVFSIRPSSPESPEGVTWGIQPNGYRARGQSLWSTLMLANYPGDSSRWKGDMLPGVPPWAISTLYDIDARVSGADLQRWQQQDSDHKLLSAMLLGALQERCHLLTHRDPMQRKVFALVLDKNGPKFQPVKAGATKPEQGVAFGEGSLIPGNGTLQLRGVSLNSLAAYLSRSSPRAIVDRTGLPGLYDFTLTRKEQDAGSSGDPDVPSLWNVDALGLSLKSAEVPGYVVRVDRLERPSPN